MGDVAIRGSPRAYPNDRIPVGDKLETQPGRNPDQVSGRDEAAISIRGRMPLHGIAQGVTERPLHHWWLSRAICGETMQNRLRSPRNAVVGAFSPPYIAQDTPFVSVWIEGMDERGRFR